MKKVLLLLIILTLVVGCSNEMQVKEIEENTTTDLTENVPPIEETNTTEKPVEEETEEVNLGCEDNSDCAWDEKCIDETCGKIEELYETEECTEKCNFNTIIVETSDGETFNLNRGKGSYTAAGAIEWTLVSGPDYCQSEEIIVLVKIEKKDLGDIINEQYITVNVGEESEIITHPNIGSIEFTFTVKSVEEECE